MKNILFVFLGGGIGSLLRFGLAQLLRNYPTQFPYATLAANVLSCFLFGCLMGWLPEKEMPASLRLLLITGFCGGLSTFSTFAYETNALHQNGLSWYSLLNIIANFVLSISALYIGQWLIKSALYGN